MITRSVRARRPEHPVAARARRGKIPRAMPTEPRGTRSRVEPKAPSQCAKTAPGRSRVLDVGEPKPTSYQVARSAGARVARYRLKPLRRNAWGSSSDRRAAFRATTRPRSSSARRMSFMSRANSARTCLQIPHGAAGKGPTITTAQAIGSQSPEAIIAATAHRSAHIAAP